jgi:hypothetical protein
VFCACENNGAPLPQRQATIIKIRAIWIRILYKFLKLDAAQPAGDIRSDVRSFSKQRVSLVEFQFDRLRFGDGGLCG